jgi:hypothetical protein
MPAAPYVALNVLAASVTFIVPRVVDVPAVDENVLVIVSSPVVVQASYILPGVFSLITVFLLESFSK